MEHVEHVVYILGAGFSAPLGLPVMSDFRQKARDMIRSEPAKYQHFNEAFGLFRDLAEIKHFLKSDQLNIEEVLSVLEVERIIEDRDTSLFTEMIRDVIKYYTPPLRASENGVAMIPPQIFGDKWHRHGYFVLGLLNRTCERYKQSDRDYIRLVPSKQDCAYAVVTLNYDLVVENAAETAQKYAHKMDEGVLLQVHPASGPLHAIGPMLCKLHGSAATGQNIVLPTWNKALQDEKIIATWRAARRVLQEANQIRFLGYSLPEADAYVRYLIKSALVRAENFRRIDVVCLDDHEQSVERRYKAFVESPLLRFRNADIGDYLKDVAETVYGSTGLEAGHETFFRR